MAAEKKEVDSDQLDVLKDIITTKLNAIRHNKFEEKSIDGFSLAFRVFLLKFLKLNYEFTDEELFSELDKKGINNALRERIMSLVNLLAEVKYREKKISKSEFDASINEAMDIIRLAAHPKKKSANISHEEKAGFFSSLILKFKKEKTKPEKLDAIKNLEGSLIKNEEEQNGLKNQVENLENELKELTENITKLEDSIRNLDAQISQKSQQYSGLGQKKIFASDSIKRKIAVPKEKEKEHKKFMDAKLKELKQRLAGKQASLMQEMNEELGKLSPDTRKAIEKWKLLEIKAKLKLEELDIKDEIAEYDGKLKEEKARLGTDSKSASSEISISQRQLKKDIEDLNRQKEQSLKEKNRISSEIDGKKSKIEKFESKIRELSSKHDEIKSNLRKARPGLGAFGFLSKLLHKEKSKEEQKKIKPEEKLKAKEEGKEAKAVAANLKRESKGIQETKEAKPKLSKPESSNLKKCYASIGGARDSLSINKISEAKKLYMEARNLYLGLEHSEKRDVYDDLMDLYGRLIR